MQLLYLYLDDINNDFQCSFSAKLVCWYVFGLPWTYMHNEDNIKCQRGLYRTLNFVLWLGYIIQIYILKLDWICVFINFFSLLWKKYL